jgi:hypothetical protein
MRAMASAILYFVLNLIGLGLGPLTVGILSDFYAEPFGDDNLRYAMASVLSIGFLGVYFLWMGTRSLNRDLEENRRELTAQR